jgi:hypothetical protein
MSSKVKPRIFRRNGPTRNEGGAFDALREYVWEVVMDEESKSQGPGAWPDTDLQTVDNRIDEMWCSETARLARVVWNPGKKPRELEGICTSNRTVRQIAQKIRIRDLGSDNVPYWIREQMYWFLMLLNVLHELAMSPWLETVAADVDSNLRSDANDLMSVLSEDGGIEVRQGRPFP